MSTRSLMLGCSSVGGSTKRKGGEMVARPGDRLHGPMRCDFMVLLYRALSDTGATVPLEPGRQSSISDPSGCIECSLYDNGRRSVCACRMGAAARVGALRADGAAVGRVAQARPRE